MTWHNRGDEQAPPPSWPEAIAGALYLWAYVAWALSVALAR